MCVWHANGRFEVGQWLTGVKLEPSLCRYQSNGRFLCYYRKFGWDWTLVECTPPYFTAHAVWTGGCTRGYDCVRTLSGRRKRVPRQIYLSTTFKKQLTNVERIEGNVLKDSTGNLVHDFTKDAFRLVPPPEDYTKGILVSAKKKQEWDYYYDV